MTKTGYFIQLVKIKLDEFKEGVRLFPVIWERPPLLSFWLSGARTAQVALIIFILTVPTIFTWTLDAVIEKTRPRSARKIISNFFKNEDPLKDKKTLGRIFLWTGSAGVVVFLLMIQVPVSIRRAESKSGECEHEADTLSDARPLSSMQLYQNALSLSTDANHIHIIQEKIKRLENKIASSTSKASQAADHSKSLSETVIFAEETSEDISYVGQAHRYHLKGTLGKGATGIVHRAHDTVLERDVAIKELLADLSHDKDLVSRFRQEAKVLAQLTHPNIVQVYDFIEEADRIWIVIELVEGGELAAILKERGCLSVPETAVLGAQLAEAMAYAHSRGVIHRDFKPSNVLLTKEGLPKITDFGLAKLTTADQRTQIGTILGSPAYMSPEQASGAIADSRSDIYAMGIVLYRMLSGKVPFEGDIAGVIAQHINKEPVPLRQIVADIPAKLEELVMSMLIKDPSKRLQNMTVASQTLSAFKN